MTWVNQLLQRWRRFVVSGFSDSLTQEEYHLAQLIHAFTVLGFIVLTVFGIENIREGQHVAGVTELIIAGFGVLNLLYLRTEQVISQSATNVLLMVVALLLIVLLEGGVDRTGIYWFSAFPILGFFLKGKLGGFKWLLFFLLLMFVAAFLNDRQIIDAAYSWREIRQAAASMALIGALVYLYYAYIHGQDQALLFEREQEFLRKNRALEERLRAEQIAKAQQAELIDRIDQTIVEVQQKNKDLEDTKAAMLNLLEDLEDAKQRVEQDKAKDVALLSSLGEGMIATNEAHEITVVNREAEELLGKSMDQLRGKLLFEAVQVRNGDGSPLRQAERVYSKALAAGHPVVSTDVEMQRANDGWFPVALTASPIVMGTKQIGGVIVFRDISNEKQIDKAKTEFVSLASHQLRTPLSATNWYVEMLLSGDAGKLTKEQQEYLQEIHRGNQRLVDLVNSLLNVSRLELGTFMVDPKPVKVDEVAESVISELEPLAKKKDVVLKRAFDVDIPTLQADEGLIRMIVQNLGSNAIKYNKDGGSVTFTLTTEAPFLVLKVADTGIGIPKSQLDRIFEKLFRADNVLKTNTDGTGLGLYIVKQILDETGGDIVLKSTLNKGTEFTVKIPLSGMKKKEGTRRLA